VETAKGVLNLSDEESENLRLAGLLHDIGHYPYSHLMEYVDRVKLTEEHVQGESKRTVKPNPYPKHTKLGEVIITEQADIREAIGGGHRAVQISKLFTGDANQSHLVKLITSTLDMDRLDYLPRDARATGVPYGDADLNYLLQN